MSESPLYRQILGSEFAALDEPVRRFHSLQGHHRLRGRCTVNGAEHAVGRFVCAMLGLPRRVSDAEFQFDLEADPNGEIWIRHFPNADHAIPARQARHGIACASASGRPP